MESRCAAAIASESGAPARRMSYETWCSMTQRRGVSIGYDSRRIDIMCMRISALTLAALMLAAPVRAQGHGYTPADIENGGLLYQANCTACHGPDGDGVPGINLGSGKFRRGT